jgi:hypothetical protein
VCVPSRYHIYQYKWIHYVLAAGIRHLGSAATKWIHYFIIFWVAAPSYNRCCITCLGGYEVDQVYKLGTNHIIGRSFSWDESILWTHFFPLLAAASLHHAQTWGGLCLIIELHIPIGVNLLQLQRRKRTVLYGSFYRYV